MRHMCQKSRLRTKNECACRDETSLVIETDLQKLAPTSLRIRSHRNFASISERPLEISTEQFPLQRCEGNESSLIEKDKNARELARSIFFQVETVWRERQFQLSQLNSAGQVLAAAV